MKAIFPTITVLLSLSSPATAEQFGLFTYEVDAGIRTPWTTTKL